MVTATKEIKLEVHMCAARRMFVVVFEGPNADRMAADYYQRNAGRFAFEETEESPLTYEQCPLLLKLMYPLCEHGLSLEFCDGPNHYPADNPYYD